jgi:two-component system cell cycle sensor histidine kinase/response regulator CckA
VRSATSGDSALDLLKKNPDSFDIVITDQQMPNMTGLELAKEALVILPDIPILLLTGDDSGLSEKLIKSSDIREVLKKPLEENILITAISKALNK